MGSQKAPKPDKQIGLAALENAATAREMLGIGRDSLAFSKEQYADSMAELERLRPTLDALSAGQIKATTLANEITQQARDDYNTTYRPIEQRVAADAAKAGSLGEQEQAAGRAGIDVQRQMDMQRDISDRSLMSTGVNPNSGKFASGNRSAMILGAAARAGAETGAREREKLKGDMMRSSVAAMGKGMTGTALTGIQVGGAAAGQAAGLAANGMNQKNSLGQQYLGNMGGAQGMMGNAASTNASSANILNDLYANKISAFQASSQSSGALGAGLGQMAGMGMMMMSDENAKTGKKKVKGARKAVDNMRVEKWRYKPGTPYTDADQAEHVGTYAQDFQRETGLGDGKTINVIDAIGVNMAAVKELSRDVRSLRKQFQTRGVAA
jgi:hypothetical protein